MTNPLVDLSSLAAQWEAKRSARGAEETWAGKTLAQNRANTKATNSTEAAQPTDGFARVRKETKGRGGKAVTVVQGIVISDEEIAALAKQLKALCGSGGTVKDGAIEIQGDHVQRIMEALQAKGIKAKKSGG